MSNFTSADMHPPSIPESSGVPAIAPQSHVNQVMAAKILTALETLDDEDSAQTEKRVHQFFYSISDQVGAESVLKSIQSVVGQLEPETLALALGAMRKACMRFDGKAFGRPYTAHMVLLPLIVRGPVPARFPTSIAAEHMNHVHIFLSEILKKKGSIGTDIYPLPLAYAYTMPQFSEEKLHRIHDILRASMAGASPHKTMATAPNYVDAGPISVSENYFDDELHDLSIASLGAPMWSEMFKVREANNTPIAKLHVGDWVTFRLMPVVLLVPRGIEPPKIEGFANDTELFGTILSFASTPQTGPSSDSKIKEAEDMLVQVTPMGLYSPEHAPAVARLSVAQSRLLTDFRQAQTEMKPDTAARLNYEPSAECLTVVYRDDSLNYSRRIHVPPGILAERFIASLTSDLNAWGIPVQFDMGDSMIAMNGPHSLLLH